MASSSHAYRRQAQALYAMAEAHPFGDVRNEFIAIARQYEILARHAAANERRATRGSVGAGPAPLPSDLVPEG